VRAIEPQSRTTDEIVADIIKVIDGGPAIEEYVRALVGACRFLKDFGPFEGNRKANEEFAHDMIKWIDDGRKLKFPKHGMVFEILFGPKQDASDNSPERLHAVAQQAEANYKDLSDRMQVLRQRRELIIEREVGVHGSVGYLQVSAAIGARGLCEKVGAPLAWSSSTSTYRMVAGHLYEAMGQNVCSVMRASSSADFGKTFARSSRRADRETDRALERACKFIAERPLIHDV
jgi:hypothetical protein